MKKIVSMLLIIVFCLGLAACGEETTVPDGYQLISGERSPYRFYAPKSWSVNTGTSQNSAYYSTTDRSLVVVSFYVPDEGQEKIDDFWSYSESLYKTTYTDYTFVESAATTLGGRNAMSYTFTANIGGNNFKVMQVIAASGSYYYMLTYTSTPECFDLHMDDVNGMIGVFEFK